LTWKDNLKVLEELEKGGSIKACARKHHVAPKNVRQWRSPSLQFAYTMCNVTTRHSFLSRQTMHKGRAPRTEKDTLQKILTMYQELRDRDRIFTLNLLAAELKRLDRSVQCVSLTAIRRRIWRHIKKHGVFRRCLTHVAQNTRYEQSDIPGWVSYVNHSIKIGNYKACDVVIMDETNIDFDLASGTTLAGRGEQTIGYATKGSSARCTVLLGVTMGGEKLPPFIIYKGANTSHSLIKREWNDLEARQKFGYPEGQVYTVQAKAWMDEQAMMKWVDEVWGHYTKDL
jgi:transposase-like protein